MGIGVSVGTGGKDAQVGVVGGSNSASGVSVAQVGVVGGSGVDSNSALGVGGESVSRGWAFVTGVLAANKKLGLVPQGCAGVSSVRCSSPVSPSTTLCSSVLGGGMGLPVGQSDQDKGCIGRDGVTGCVGQSVASLGVGT